ncbi:uncharacterized protein Z518_03099 [Rhinocladiella mackenziei CBS 650.93]|uniref:Uncharacterized protein n=1 Tax=Rhinocladiella mackenziei CBS 650.93 TaxID=1442369 RepID=A0A0D2HD87_9EURO|nr:uncharacterized protein Z518_03099 [Rhinocladiella mackenziei CBS 650.93]KIX08443.1 hypothetical protein Z518_03099 [Rhinocladiella mackenziei CBS 650.93]
MASRRGSNEDNGRGNASTTHDVQQREQAETTEEIRIWCEMVFRYLRREVRIKTSKLCNTITGAELDSLGERENMVLAADDDRHAREHDGYLGQIKFMLQSTAAEKSEVRMFCVVENEDSAIVLNRSTIPQGSGEPAVLTISNSSAGSKDEARMLREAWERVRKREKERSEKKHDGEEDRKDQEERDKANQTTQTNQAN